MAKYMVLLALVVGVVMVTMPGCGKDDPNKDAQTKVEKVNKYISEKNYDDAENLLKELQADKAKYSKEVQVSIDAAEAALKTAKGTKLTDLLPK